MNKKRQQGDAFEKAAAAYLAKQGLSLLDTQARYAVGELDLVMKDKSCIVFVEVRFRRSQEFGGAAASISAAKQRRLLKSAYLWLAQHGQRTSHTEFRFDAVTFEGDIKSVNWIQNFIVEG